jgi:hypothetical protein
VRGRRGSRFANLKVPLRSCRYRRVVSSRRCSNARTVRATYLAPADFQTIAHSYPESYGRSPRSRRIEVADRAARTNERISLYCNVASDRVRSTSPMLVYRPYGQRIPCASDNKNFSYGSISASCISTFLPDFDL